MPVDNLSKLVMTPLPWHDHEYSDFELMSFARRGISPDEQTTKLNNLAWIQNSGRRVKCIRHDCYQVEHMPGYYNPYTDSWSPGATWHP